MTMTTGSGTLALASVTTPFQQISLSRKDTVSIMELHAITGIPKKTTAKNGENLRERSGVIQITHGAMSTHLAMTPSQPSTSMVLITKTCSTGESAMIKFGHRALETSLLHLQLLLLLPLLQCEP